MRFGAKVRTAADRQDWIDTVKRIEDAGFSTLVIPDHLDTIPIVPALAFAAAHTTTLRLGSLVFCQDYRNPRILAREAVWLDELSGGRFELGIGAGWLKSEYHQLEIPFFDADIRIERLEHTVAVIRESYPGKLLVGGGGRKLLELAGRTADIVNITFPQREGPMPPSGPELLRKQVIWAGNRAEKSVQIPWLEITEHRQDAVQRLAKEWDYPPELLKKSEYALIGPLNWIREELARKRELYGINYFILDGANPDAAKLIR